MPLHGPRNFCGHLVQVAVVTLTQMNIISVARLLRMREHTRYICSRTNAAGMDACCKACGERLVDSKGRRRQLQGLCYSALFEISSGSPNVTAAEVHKLLANSPCYVCKTCNSTLLKYSSISEQLRRIKRFLTTGLSCAPEAVSYSD